MSRRPRRTSRFAHSEHAVRRAVTGFRRTFPHSGASEPAHDDQVSDFLSTIDPLARTHPERAADANASSSQPREWPL